MKYPETNVPIERFPFLFLFRFQHKELQNTDFQSNRDDVHYNKYRKNHTSRKNGYTQQTGKIRKLQDAPPKKMSVQDRSKGAIKLRCKLGNKRKNSAPGCMDDGTVLYTIFCKSRKMGYTQQTRKKRKLQDSPPKKMSIQDRNKEAMKLSGKLENKADNYVLVADFVKKFRDGIIRLKENKVTNNLQIRICELDDTMFLGENYRLESWGEVYLSKPTKLEILGLLESSQGMALFPQCIVLVGEERHIYCYRNEVLYLFANSLKELLQDGVPNIDTYYDYPDDISDEEEEVLQNDKEVQRLRQVTKEFIDKDADEFNDFYAQFIL